MYLQRCLIVTWQVPRKTAAISARSVYTIQPYNHAPCHVTSLMQSHIRKVRACQFSCNLPPALLVEWLASLCAVYCGNTRVERIQKERKKERKNKTKQANQLKQQSAQKVDTGEENSPAAPAGTRTRDLSITSPGL